MRRLSLIFGGLGAFYLVAALAWMGFAPGPDPLVTIVIPYSLAFAGLGFVIASGIVALGTRRERAVSRARPPKRSAQRRPDAASRPRPSPRRRRASH